MVNAVADLDVMIEQPCLTYEECQQVRSHSSQTMKLDELVTDMTMAERIVRDGAADVACVKNGAYRRVNKGQQNT